MNNNLKYKIILFGIFLMLIISLVVVDTFALFETNAESTNNMEIGKWKILLNNNDISLVKTISLNNFTYNNGVHTENNYFAPGSSASFDVVIDATQSDVSMEYDLEIDTSSISDYPNINFTILNVGTNEMLTSSNYNGIIYLNDQNRVITLRIAVVWNDLAEYDESDTKLIGSELNFEIAANFKQYIGE